jgi:hypothetical protein
MESILILLLSILAVVMAKTDLDGCTTSEVVVDGLVSRTFYLCPSFISVDVIIPTAAASTALDDIIASVLVGRDTLHDTSSCPSFSASTSDSIIAPPASAPTTFATPTPTEPATSTATEPGEQPATTSYSASLITSSVIESESRNSTVSIEESSSHSHSITSTASIASVPTAVSTSSTITSANAAVATRPAVLALGGLAMAAALAI